MMAVLSGWRAAVWASMRPRSMMCLDSRWPLDGRLHAHADGAAGDVDDLAADEAGVVRGEEGDHAGDFGGLTDAAERDARRGGGGHLLEGDAHALGGGARHLGVNEAGGDRVGGDA